MRVLLSTVGMVVLWVVIGCGGDGSGGASAGSSTTLVKAIDSDGYDALCVRFGKSSDLSVLDECTSEMTTAACKECTDGLLGGGGDCTEYLGTVGKYPDGCDWTVGKLNQCFDQREQLQKTLSCDKPGRKQTSDADDCMYEFRKKCVPSSI